MAKRSSFKFLKQNETRNFCNYSYNNEKKTSKYCTIRDRVIILVQKSTYENQLSFSTYTYIQMHSTYSYILQPKGIIYPKSICK